MKLSYALWTFAVLFAPVAVMGQAESVLGSASGLNSGGGAAAGLGGVGDTASPAKVTGQLNGLLGGLGLNNLDLRHVLAINWDNDKVGIRSEGRLCRHD